MRTMRLKRGLFSLVGPTSKSRKDEYKCSMSSFSRMNSVLKVGSMPRQVGSGTCPAWIGNAVR